MLAPGTVFAGYEVVRLIGAGAVGAVYEAVRRDKGRRVALKVLRVAVRDDEEIVARFVREAKAVALLKHPSIVEPVDVGRYKNQPYLVMELLEGESLSALMFREKKLPLGRAIDIVIPIMAAVRTVHAQSIVHRDLKPDNIFITYPNGGIRPKILDFGMAKMAEPGLQITAKDTAIGTPNFMSPEQMLSPRTVDPRSDQWSLGVLLYYLLTGVKPFDGRDLGDTLRNVLQREPAPLRQLAPDVPESVAAAVTRAMRKPPDERFASVHDFAQELIPFASDVTALQYASEFYTVAVWDALGEAAPKLGLQPSTPPTQRTRRSRAPQSSPSYPSARASNPGATATQSTPPRAPTPSMESVPVAIDASRASAVTRADKARNVVMVVAVVLALATVVAAAVLLTR